MNSKYKEMAKVASKIDDYKFVINRGSDDGVKVGDNYLIFSLGEEILDPDTRESLGLLEIVRGHAKVIHVQERVATLESKDFIYTPGTKKIIRREPGAGVAAFMNLNMPRVEEIETGGDKSQSKIIVKPGDLARPI